MRQSKEGSFPTLLTPPPIQRIDPRQQNDRYRDETVQGRVFSYPVEHPILLVSRQWRRHRVRLCGNYPWQETFPRHVPGGRKRSQRKEKRRERYQWNRQAQCNTSPSTVNPTMQASPMTVKATPAKRGRRRQMRKLPQSKSSGLTPTLHISVTQRPLRRHVTEMLHRPLQVRQSNRSASSPSKKEENA